MGETVVGEVRPNEIVPVEVAADGIISASACWYHGARCAQVAGTGGSLVLSDSPSSTLTDDRTVDEIEVGDVKHSIGEPDWGGPGVWCEKGLYANFTTLSSCTVWVRGATYTKLAP